MISAAADAAGRGPAGAGAAGGGGGGGPGAPPSAREPRPEAASYLSARVQPLVRAIQSCPAHAGPDAELLPPSAAAAVLQSPFSPPARRALEAVLTALAGMRPGPQRDRALQAALALILARRAHGGAAAGAPDPAALHDVGSLKAALASFARENTSAPALGAAQQPPAAGSAAAASETERTAARVALALAGVLVTDDFAAAPGPASSSLARAFVSLAVGAPNTTGAKAAKAWCAKPRVSMKARRN